MKKFVETYFSSDIVSAVFALIIFMCVAIMITSHLFLGLLNVESFFLELMLVLTACVLLRVAYAGNKHEAGTKKTAK